MNRIIKFRGLRKDKLSTDFVIGNLIVEPNNRYWIDWFEDGIRRTTEVLGESVGQFTGLKDENGKDLYEGDILIHTGINQSDIEVFFKEGAFWVKGIFTDCIMERYLNSYDLISLQITGNIHENN